MTGEVDQIVQAGDSAFLQWYRPMYRVAQK